MKLTGLDLNFWVASLLEHLTLLGVLLTTRRAVSFPAFTALIAANATRTITLFLVLRHGSAETYFNVYWTLAIVDVCLQLAVVYEMAAHVFSPTGFWAPHVRKSLILLSAVSLITAAVLTWLAAPATQTFKQAIVIRGNFFSSVLMSGLFVGMIALSVTLGLPWRTHAARIAQGLGIYSAIGIITEAMHSYFGVVRGTSTYVLLSHIRIGTYLICAGYWILTLAREAPVTQEMPEGMYRQLASLQRRTAFVLREMQQSRQD